MRFLARGAGYSVLIMDRAATFTLPGAQVSVRMTGGRSPSAPRAEDPRESYSNYFVGNDESKWLRGVRHFGQVRVPVREGVDLVYKANQRQLEFDFDIAPRADTSDLRLHFAGAESLSLDRNGDLIIHTKAGDLREHTPVAWQEIAGQKRPVIVRHRLRGRQEVVFQVGNYDRNLPLVIDPVVSYSTYLGGSSGDTIAGIAVDSSGYAYLTGTTSSVDFPATSGSLHSGPDAFIAKLNPNGSALVYATFIGGSSSDGAYAIAIDSNGNAFITGQTSSSDFPVVFAGGSSYVSYSDGFVTEVNSSGVISASRYLAASFTSGQGIAVDTNGNAYIAGSTSSTSFPTTTGSFMPAKPGNYSSGFVVKLDPMLNIVYGTYLGGSSTDTAVAVAVDPNGDAYVAGSANSSNFPVTAGSFQTASKGNTDAILVELNAAGSALVFGTFLGGSNSDSASAIALDQSGNVYVAGSTTSTDFPVTSGAFSASRNSNYYSSAFVTKVNAGGATLAYSTYLSGSNNDSATAIAVNAAGNAFVLGPANSLDFPTTPGTLKTQKSSTNYYSDEDLFLSEFNPAGSSLIYSTYLGTMANDTPGGLSHRLQRRRLCCG